MKEKELHNLLKNFYSEMRGICEEIDRDTSYSEDMTNMDENAGWVEDCLQKYVRKIRDSICN